MRVPPDKRLRSLYGYAVNWCTKRDVPLSWIRAYGRYLYTAEHPVILFDGSEWESPLLVTDGARLEVEITVPRHPFRGGYGNRLDRGIVWIAAPSLDEFRERGLAGYERELDLGLGSTRLVLASASVWGDHVFKKYQQTRYLMGESFIDTRYECRACGLVCLEIPQFSPCKFIVEPMLDIAPVESGEWEFFFPD